MGLQGKTWSDRTGILVGNVLGSKAWLEGYLVGLASSVWRKVFAKLSSLIVFTVCLYVAVLVPVRSRGEDLGLAAQSMPRRSSWSNSHKDETSLQDMPVIIFLDPLAVLSLPICPSIILRSQLAVDEREVVSAHKHDIDI